MMDYPKKVKAVDFVGACFAPGLFKIDGGRALYDEIWMADGGNALYLCRVESVDGGLKVIRRWIDWDTDLIMMFDPEAQPPVTAP
jgi:hypothetical protein